jgi:CRP-like cAMP-binding protein
MGHLEIIYRLRTMMPKFGWKVAPTVVESSEDGPYLSQSKKKPVSESNFNIQDVQLDILMALISFLNCLFTPIIIGLQDKVNFSALEIICLVMDSVIFMEFVLPLLYTRMKTAFEFHIRKESYISTNLESSSIEPGTVLHQMQEPSRSVKTHQADSECETYITVRASDFMKVLSFSTVLTIPIAYIYDFSGGISSLLCCTRLLQLHRISHAIRKVKLALHDASILLDEPLIRVLEMFVYVIQSSTILACIWFYLAYGGSKHPFPLSWAANDDILNGENVASKFFRSLYFVTQTLFTVGFGDIYPKSNSELLFSICLVMWASLFFAYVIAALTSLMATRTLSLKRFRNELMSLRRYLTLLKLPTKIQNRVNTYMDFIRTRQMGMHEDRFLFELPHCLTRSVMSKYLEFLKTVPFFLGGRASNEFLRLCVEKLSFRTYIPGSVVAHEGEKRRELLLIRTGRIDLYVGEYATPLSTLVAGDHFGDFMLLFGSGSELKAVAAVYCEVLVLSYYDFSEALQEEERILRTSDGDKDKMNEDLHYRRASGLQSTVDEHISYLNKFQKVQNVMEIAKRKNDKKSKKLADMMMMSTRSSNFAVIMPESKFKIIWNGIITCGILYYLTWIPFRIMMNWNCHLGETESCLSMFHFSLVFDYCIDFLLLADWVLRSFFFAYKIYEDENEIVVKDRADIYRHYQRTYRYILTIVVSTPLDLLALRWNGIQLWRLSKLLSVGLLQETLFMFISDLEFTFEMTISTEIVTVINLSLVTVLAIFWMSCIWSVLHFNSFAFVESMYFCLTTMTTTGYGDINPVTLFETIYVTMCSIAGPCLFTIIIANIVAAAHVNETSTDNVAHRKEVAKCFIKSINESEDASSRPAIRDDLENQKSDVTVLQKRVADHYDYISNKLGGVTESDMLSLMIPNYLREELRQFDLIEFLDKSPVFKDCCKVFHLTLVNKFDHQIYPKGSVLVSMQSRMGGMFVVRNGVISISDNKSRAHKHLTKGKSFGEFSLFRECALAPFHMRAYTDCEVYFLSKRAFDQISRSYPVDDQCRSSMIAQSSFALTENLAYHGDTELSLLHNIREKQFQRKYSIFIDPNSSLYQYWFLLPFFVCIYNLIVLPLRIAFQEYTPFSFKYFVPEYFGDIILLVDVVLRSCFVAIYEDDSLIMDRGKITAAYRKKYGTLQIIASLPFDILAFIHHGKWGIFHQTQVVSILRLIRLLRIHDLKDYVSSLEVLITGKGSQFDSSSWMRRVLMLVRLFLILLTIGHYAGCFFFLVANNSHYFGDAANWADANNLLRHCSFNAFSDSGMELDACPAAPWRILRTQYIRSLYWGIATITSVGYGDVSAISPREMMYTILVFVAGAILYAQVIVQLEAIVINMDVTTSLFIGRKEKLARFFQREITDSGCDIDKRGLYYLNRLWKRQKGASGSEVKAFLSHNDYRDILRNSLTNALKQEVCFKAFPMNVLDALACSFEVEWLIPGATVFHYGEISSRLIFVIRGELSMMNPFDGQEYTRLRGGILCASEFFLRLCYNCSCTAATETAIFSVSYSKFWKMLEELDVEALYANALIENEATLESMLFAYTPENISKTIAENLQSSDEGRIELNGNDANHSSFVILPDSTLAIAWSTIVLIAVIYSLLSAPFVATFGIGESLSNMLLVDSFVYVIFGADIFFRANFIAIEAHDHMITDRMIFSRIFAREETIYLIPGAFPLAPIIYAFSGDSMYYSTARLVYIFNALRLPYLLNRLSSLTRTIHIFRWSPEFTCMLQIFSIVIYLCHVCSCIFYLIGVIDDTSWIYSNDLANAGDFRIYLTSFYWSCYTIVTVGYGSVSLNTDVERLFAISIMLLGAVFCDAGLAAAMGAIINRVDGAQSVQHRKFECMIAHSLSNERDQALLDKVKSYFSYSSTHMNNSNEESDFHLLSESLRLEFSSHFALQDLMRNELIRLPPGSEYFRRGFIFSVLRHAKLDLLPPGESISVATSLLGYDWYVLRRGRVYFHSKKRGGQKYYIKSGEALSSSADANENDFGSNGDSSSETSTASSLNTCGIKGPKLEIVAIKANISQKCAKIVNRNEVTLAVENSFSGGKNETSPSKKYFRRTGSFSYSGISSMIGGHGTVPNEPLSEKIASAAPAQISNSSNWSVKWGEDLELLTPTGDELIKFSIHEYCGLDSNTMNSESESKTVLCSATVSLSKLLAGSIKEKGQSLFTDEETKFAGDLDRFSTCAEESLDSEACSYRDLDFGPEIQQIQLTDSNGDLVGSLFITSRILDPNSKGSGNNPSTASISNQESASESIGRLKVAASPVMERRKGMGRLGSMVEDLSSHDALRNGELAITESYCHFLYVPSIEVRKLFEEYSLIHSPIVERLMLFEPCQCPTSSKTSKSSGTDSESDTDSSLDSYSSSRSDSSSNSSSTEPSLAKGVNHQDLKRGPPDIVDSAIGTDKAHPQVRQFRRGRRDSTVLPILSALDLTVPKWTPGEEQTPVIPGSKQVRSISSKLGASISRLSASPLIAKQRPHRGVLQRRGSLVNEGSQRIHDKLGISAMVSNLRRGSIELNKNSSRFKRIQENFRD